MPKKNNSNKYNTVFNNCENKKPLILKEDQETYGQIINTLGDNRMLVKCFDGKDRVCTIRGSMRKKIWIYKNDIVLISLREYQDDKGDIVHKYEDQDVKKLKKLNEISIDKKEQDNLNEYELMDINNI